MMIAKIKKFVYSNGALILAGVLAAAFAVNSVQVITRNWRLQREINRLGSEVALLRVENERLTYDIAYYQTDQYLEQAVRQKLNLKAPGERVAVVAHSGETLLSAPNDEPEISPPKPKSNWRTWMDFLGGRTN
jgi:cell division protein FtsB